MAPSTFKHLAPPSASASSSGYKLNIEGLSAPLAFDDVNIGNNLQPTALPVISDVILAPDVVVATDVNVVTAGSIADGMAKTARQNQAATEMKAVSTGSHERAALGFVHVVKKALWLLKITGISSSTLLPVAVMQLDNPLQVVAKPLDDCLTLLHNFKEFSHSLLAKFLVHSASDIVFTVAPSPASQSLEEVLDKDPPPIDIPISELFVDSTEPASQDDSFILELERIRQNRCKSSLFRLRLRDMNFVVQGSKSSIKLHKDLCL
ncbi:hypothetical protein M9H77_07228 [Catharanthus roseus]|uniref:Uncharacterized protein n=1 Tax=Catharanthus roseus TaxID=4058 RepID=A0ACC0BUM4_CATRO|nr:hypothetical protein M9H77_07228 [Catharanthus roseus]